MATIEYQEMKKIDDLLFIDSFSEKEIKELAYIALGYRKFSRSQMDQAIEKLMLFPGLKKLFVGDSSILAKISLPGINGTYFVDYAEDLSISGYVEHMDIDFDEIREQDISYLIEDLDQTKKECHQVDKCVISELLELNAKPVKINEKIGENKFRHRVSFQDIRIDGSYRLINLESITNAFVPMYQLYVPTDKR